MEGCGIYFYLDIAFYVVKVDFLCITGNDYLDFFLGSKLSLEVLFGDRFY
jgi:hypothetical protein